ncbi:MAG: class I SAM-dependent RNA methyltransferase [Bacteroidetes bacterium]|nr:class I SAM-dependent RNA methyltransferase [Bacteroidota bacterium]
MRFIAKSLFGLEEVLAREIRDAGGESVQVRNRAVVFEGGTETLYAVNYTSRTAISVLMEIVSFNIERDSDLYDRAVKTDWGSYMSADNTFAVTAVVNSPFYKHTAYPGLVVKDAIADHFRKHTGRRPSVDPSHPGILVNLHISNREVTISLDSSVVPLFKRGYRKNQGTAPLNESLAAGMIMLTGWHGDRSFHDPMCGSGTLPVEAGLIAAGIPPGYFREFFGFHNWKSYDPDLFSTIKQKYNSAIRPVGVLISGSDISMQAVKLARETVANAGLEGDVKIVRDDFTVGGTPRNDGIMILNPPYGKRINAGEVSKLYSTIGTTLKHKCAGVEAWIFSGSDEAIKAVALKPSKRIKLFNGSIECHFNRYFIEAGKFSSGKNYQ